MCAFELDGGSNVFKMAQTARKKVFVGYDEPGAGSFFKAVRSDPALR